LCPDAQARPPAQYAAGPAAGGLFDPMLTSDALALCTSDASWLQAMLDVEAALALAGSDCGLVPDGAAEAIGRCCAAERFDPSDLGRQGRLGANPVIPLVAQLRNAAEAEMPGAGDFVHLGATSQDILDTAGMLVVRAASAVTLAELGRLAAGAAKLAAAHRATVMSGRTLLQQAVPTTFGLKAAGWLVAVLDASEILDHVVSERLAVQLAGAAGTLASLGDAGPAVVTALGSRLRLATPTIGWHSDRTRLAEVANAFAIAAATSGKIALDVSLLMQTEVGEAFEPAAPGRGSSSAMPQKRNPALSAAALACARLAAASAGLFLGSMIQEHERGVGWLQAEWPALTDLMRRAGTAVGLMADVLSGLEVDTAAMAANLAASGGLAMAENVVAQLSKRLPPGQAKRVVEEACLAVRAAGAGSRLDSEVLARLPDGHGVAAGELAAWVDPATYTGSAEWLVDKALERLTLQRARARHPGGSS
jgi:3-carboxy-cis,cis-muconate cycloisomerase